MERDIGRTLSARETCLCPAHPSRCRGPRFACGYCDFLSSGNLVKGVLEHIVGPEAAQQIPVRGGDRSWQYKGAGSLDGKQPHMASAVEELESRNGGVQVSKATTLLIDDDVRNIRFALMDGTRALWFNPKKPHFLLQDILKLE